jgi:hypothetical protein
MARAPYTVPVYQQRATNPLDAYDPSFKLQDVYGTGALPYLDWVEMVKTGERTITPEDPIDQRYIDRYNMEAQQTGAQSFGDMMKGLAPSIAGYTAGAAYDVFTDPYLEGSFGDKVLRTGASLLPEQVPFTDVQLREPLPQSVMDASVARGQRLNRVGPTDISQIPQGKEYFPGLGTKAEATTLGKINLYNKLNEPDYLDFPDVTEPYKQNPSQGTLVGIGRDRLGRPVQTADTSLVYDPADVAQAEASLGLESSIEPVEAASTALSGIGDYFTDPGNYMRGVVGGVAGFGTALLTGQDPAVAARAAVGGTIGGIAGGVFGPIGSMIGAAFGASLTRKRVICNELVRQGLMSREHMMLDYKFTKEHLTPQHVRGYHFWAVPVVRKMREGKSVGFWRHIATHRANEIAHIYGKRDKPDYLGKVYRRIFEPACWIVGAICKQKDWQSLYSTKGI